MSIDQPPQPVPERGILIFDGLFLHRRELDKYWHLSVLLVAGSALRGRLAEMAAP